MIKIVIINDIPRNVSQDLRAISRNNCRYILNNGNIIRLSVQLAKVTSRG